MEDLNTSPRSWQEDFNSENGNYFNNCPSCHLQFLGHKRRHICKVCTKLHMVTQAGLISTLAIELAASDAVDLSSILARAEGIRKKIIDVLSDNKFVLLPQSNILPWNRPELKGWSIGAMNHYYLEHDKETRRIYIAVSKGTRMVKVEGPDTPYIWDNLIAKVKDVDESDRATQ